MIGAPRQSATSVTGRMECVEKGIEKVKLGRKFRTVYNNLQVRAEGARVIRRWWS